MQPHLPSLLNTLFIYKQNLETVLNELLFSWEYERRKIKCYLELVVSSGLQFSLLIFKSSKTFQNLQNISTVSKTGEGVTESRFLKFKIIFLQENRLTFVNNFQQNLTVCYFWQFGVSSRSVVSP